MDFLECTDCMPLDLSKKASTDSFKEVEPVTPTRYDSSRSGLSSFIPSQSESFLYRGESSQSLESRQNETAEERYKSIKYISRGIIDWQACTRLMDWKHCNKAINQKSNLEDHSRIHSENKPYKCRECSKAFTRKFILKVHSDIHSGNRRYKCKECDKAFSRLCHPKSHSVIHTGKRSYQCKECH